MHFKKGEIMSITMQEAARGIGGAISRAHSLTIERTNRVLKETRKFSDIAMAAADGFEKKYFELLEIAEKFTFSVNILIENDCPSALDGLERGIEWLREHKDEAVDKGFYGNYMYGYSGDIYKSEIKIAREKTGLTQQQFAEMFDISIDTVKSWDCGRRRPDKLKESLIIKELARIAENNGE